MAEPKPKATYREKYTTEMTFNEFVDWSAGYVLVGLGTGLGLRAMMYTIVNAVCLNEVFGGKRKD